LKTGIIIRIDNSPFAGAGCSTTPELSGNMEKNIREFLETIARFCLFCHVNSAVYMKFPVLAKTGNFCPRIGKCFFGAEYFIVSSFSSIRTAEEHSMKNKIS
jgi:hypothetical protein